MEKRIVNTNDDSRQSTTTISINGPCRRLPFSSSWEESPPASEAIHPGDSLLNLAETDRRRCIDKYGLDPIEDRIVPEDQRNGSSSFMATAVAAEQVPAFYWSTVVIQNPKKRKLADESTERSKRRYSSADRRRERISMLATFARRNDAPQNLQFKAADVNRERHPIDIGDYGHPPSATTIVSTRSQRIQSPAAGKSIITHLPPNID